MAASLAVGILVKQAFGELFKHLKDLIGKNIDFGTVLGDIKSSLVSFEPKIQHLQDICSSEEELQGLLEVFEKGKVLVGKCLVTRRSNIFKISSLSENLCKWEKSFQTQLEVLGVQGTIDGKKTLGSVQTIEKVVNSLDTTAQNTERSVQKMSDQLDDIMASTRVQNIERTVQRIDAQLLEQKEALKSVISTHYAICCAVPELPQHTVGLDIPLQKLKKKMFQDGESMVVVSAIGGSGKTTLAIALCHDQEVKDEFKNNIFFVTLGREPNFEGIVKQLYQRKGQRPAFANNAYEMLQKFLTEGQEPLLLVLDDVWPDSDTFLNRFRCERLKNYKILLTSRSSLRFVFQYTLEILNDDNAKKLLARSASLSDMSFEMSCLSKEILQCCKGLPLAIEVVGASLLGEPIETWRARVHDLSRGQSIIDSEEELRNCLQISIDALPKTIKKYYLDLGTFPKDNRISVAALIDMWAGLYDLAPDTATRGVGKLTPEVEDTVCIANLIKLKNRNLIKLVDMRKDKIEEDGYYYEHYITQHDLLGDLLAHQVGLESAEQRKRLVIDIRGNIIPKWWRKQKFHSMQARLLSVRTDGAFSDKLPDMALPEATVLILTFQKRTYVLPKFVENMHNLKVLLVRYDGTSHAELSDFQLVNLLPRLVRIRLERVSICSMTEKPIKLESLLKMSLFMCDLRTFTEGGVKISDAFPKLEELNIEDCLHVENFFTMCCDLVHLRKISITKCHNLVSLPNGIGRLVKLEMLRLRSCTDLSMFPDSVKDLKNLKFLDISDCSSISQLPKYIGELRSLLKLDMRRCAYIEELPQSVVNLKQLKEVICSHKTRKLWEAVEPSLGSSIRIVAMPLNWSDFYN